MFTYSVNTGDYLSTYSELLLLAGLAPSDLTQLCLSFDSGGQGERALMHGPPWQTPWASWRHLKDMPSFHPKPEVPDAFKRPSETWDLIICRNWYSWWVQGQSPADTRTTYYQYNVAVVQY